MSLKSKPINTTTREERDLFLLKVLNMYDNNIVI